MRFLNYLMFTLYLCAASFVLGRYSYWDAEGFGFYVPSLGGYHVALQGELIP